MGQTTINKTIWFVFICIIILMVSMYGIGYAIGKKSVPTTPVVTQAQRIKALESQVEMLVNNEQISAEDSMKLEQLEEELLTHIEESIAATEVAP